MKIKSPGIVNIDHIMWQPYLDCSKRCKGCYVKLAGDSEHDVMCDDIVRLIMDGKVLCNQLTISLNSFNTPNPPFEPLPDILSALWVWVQEQTDAPELCVSINDVTTLLKWQRALKMSPQEFLRPVSLLSLSNMPVQGKKCLELQELCSKVGTTLHYNKLVKKSVLSDKAFEIGCRYAHQTYLVLHKSPLGEEQDPLSVGIWLDALKECARHTKNFYPDSCCGAARNFNVEGEHCSAGIDRVHVWPSGRVTACPYDSHNVCGRQGKPHDTWEELEEITYGDRPHPMEKCRIPEALRQIQKGLRNSDKVVAPQEEQR